MLRLAVGTVLVLGIAVLAQAQAKPKYTILEVMLTAHKDGLLKKVTDGKASDAEKKQLVDFYVALGQNKPPKGDPAEWRKRCDELLKLAKACAAGDQDAPAALAKAANCAACHKVFK